MTTTLHAYNSTDLDDITIRHILKANADATLLRGKFLGSGIGLNISVELNTARSESGLLRMAECIRGIVNELKSYSLTHGLVIDTLINNDESMSPGMIKEFNAQGFNILNLTLQNPVNVAVGDVVVTTSRRPFLVEAMGLNDNSLDLLGYHQAGTISREKFRRDFARVYRTSVTYAAPVK